jgi:branched-chain amino acid transport system substrate-binding protein
MRPLILLLLLIVTALPATTRAAPIQAPVMIGFDAEIGHKTSTSDEAIRLGIELAINEINAAGGVLGGRPLQLQVLDNRSVPARGIANLKTFAAMKDLVAVFCGKFSPVVIEALPVIHEKKIILLDPWAAADRITNHNYRPDYVFRLSLRDSWAQPMLLRTLSDRKIRNIGLLLPNTAWGRSNLYGAESYAAAHPEIRLVSPQWYNWGDQSLLPAYNAILAAGADGLVLVANEAEGSLLIREIAMLPPRQRLPISAAWGITGGDFATLTGTALQQVDLEVVQTFSFARNVNPIRNRRVMAALQQNHGYDSPRKLLSPVGFGQAYDLTHLLALAINQAKSTDRAQIRTALENLPAWDGLVRQYNPAFTATRHDALGPEDLFMARYAADGALLPVAGKQP